MLRGKICPQGIDQASSPLRLNPVQVAESHSREVQLGHGHERRLHIDSGGTLPELVDQGSQQEEGGNQGGRAETNPDHSDEIELRTPVNSWDGR